MPQETAFFNAFGEKSGLARHFGRDEFFEISPA
jgi:hypothetical protein